MRPHVRYDGEHVQPLRTVDDLGEAMRAIVKRHAEYLLELGPVRVLSLDPCPKCMGRVIATETRAVCTSCGWSYREPLVEPVASRRADP